jgi:hypothetical protein
MHHDLFHACGLSDHTSCIRRCPQPDETTRAIILSNTRTDLDAERFVRFSANSLDITRGSRVRHVGIDRNSAVQMQRCF